MLTQSCPLPKYLVAHCGDQNKTCNFACRDPKGELHGSASLACGDDKKWIGHLPFCKGEYLDSVPKSLCLFGIIEMNI